MHPLHILLMGFLTQPLPAQCWKQGAGPDEPCCLISGVFLCSLPQGAYSPCSWRWGSWGQEWQKEPRMDVVVFPAAASLWSQMGVGLWACPYGLVFQYTRENLGMTEISYEKLASCSFCHLRWFSLVSKSFILLFLKLVLSLLFFLQIFSFSLFQQHKPLR